jgi:hypothetical protein
MVSVFSLRVSQTTFASGMLVVIVDAGEPNYGQSSLPGWNVVPPWSFAALYLTYCRQPATGSAGIEMSDT